MSDKERNKLDHDSVSVFSPQVTVHSAKYRVDGITKYLTHNSFQLDHGFDETSTTEEIYIQTTLPLVDHVLSSKGRATVFCYGQTGSGKTFTMNGIQQILAYDLYAQIFTTTKDVQIRVAMFELYGGFVQDLLHERQRCKLLEDSKGEINITGLRDVPAPTANDLLRVLEQGNRYVRYSQRYPNQSRDEWMDDFVLNSHSNLRRLVGFEQRIRQKLVVEMKLQMRCWHCKIEP